MSTLCSTCGKYEEGMKRCSGCKAVTYCSKACQRYHWPVHKLGCKRLQKDLEPESKTPAQPGYTKSGKAKHAGYVPLTIRDNLTGTTRLLGPGGIVLDPDSMLKAPRPSPAELSGLVNKLSSSLPHPKFFPQIGGNLFTFITDLRHVQPEWAVGIGSIVSLDNTILIAKIITMDVWALRHGICIVGEENDKLLIVHFYVKGDNPFPFFTWSDVRPGNYICIQAPVFHSFMDGQIGFRINDAWQVRILDASGKIISR